MLAVGHAAMNTVLLLSLAPLHFVSPPGVRVPPALHVETRPVPLWPAVSTAAPRARCVAAAGRRLSATPQAAPRGRGPFGKARKLAWSVRRSGLIWRCALIQLWRVLNLRRRTSLKGAALVEKRRELAAKLRDTLIVLGPTFIKIGQLLSTRVDVLPPEVIRELSLLQNDVPGFPARRAKAVIKKELGRPADEVYASFDPEPIAAASLAQVHRATLHSGEEVIVKVQRENLLELFEVDLWNIR